MEGDIDWKILLGFDFKPRRIDMDNKTDSLLKLTGLWLKKGKNGVFCQGQLSPWANILIFENKYKRSDKDPDFILFIGHSHRPDQPKHDDDWPVEAL